MRAEEAAPEPEQQQDQQLKAPAPPPKNVTPWIFPPSVIHHQPWGLLDIERTQGTSWNRWEEDDSVTGDWGGYRDWLADTHGFRLLGSYTSECAGNPVGGKSRGATYTHNIGVEVLANLGKLVGIQNTYFIASMSDRAGSSLSKEEIGNLLAVQEIYGFETIRLVHLALGLRMFGGSVDMVAGRIHGLDDFAASPLYCNSQNLGVCGNPFSMLKNINLSSYPNTSWGARARWEPVKWVYLMGGAYNAFAGFRDNKYHGVNFSMPSNSGVIGIGEIGFMPHWLSPDYEVDALRGHYKIGGYWDTEPLPVWSSQTPANPNGVKQRGSWGMYIAVDQMIFSESKTDWSQGLTPFLVMTWAPADKNTFQLFVDGGLVYQGLIPGRHDDIAGLFFAYGIFSDDLRFSQIALGKPGPTYETILELNYRCNLTEWFYIQPDVQGVINPGGTNNIADALVLAVQFGVPF